MFPLPWHEADLDAEALSGREDAGAAHVDADLHLRVLVSVPESDSSGKSTYWIFQHGSMVS